MQEMNKLARLIVFIGLIGIFTGCVALYISPEGQNAFDKCDTITITVSDKTACVVYGFTQHYIIDTNNNMYVLFGKQTPMRYKNYVINETYQVKICDKNAIFEEERIKNENEK